MTGSALITESIPEADFYLVFPFRFAHQEDHSCNRNSRFCADGCSTAGFQASSLVGKQAAGMPNPSERLKEKETSTALDLGIFYMSFSKCAISEGVGHK